MNSVDKVITQAGKMLCMYSTRPNPNSKFQPYSTVQYMASASGLARDGILTTQPNSNLRPSIYIKTLRT